MSRSTIIKKSSKPEIQENQLKSFFKENPKGDGVNLQFFGTLSSLQSLAAKCPLFSGSDVGKESPYNSVSDLITHSSAHQGVPLKNDPSLSASCKLEEIKPTSFFGNTDLIESEQNISSAKREQLDSMEDEILAHLKEFKEIKTHVQKLTKLSRSITSCSPVLEQAVTTPVCHSDPSAEVAEIQRVIVCESTHRSVPKVIMCDDTFEAMSTSRDVDSGSRNSTSKSFSSDKPMNTNLPGSEQKLQIQLETNQDLSNFKNCDCSLLADSSHISVISQHQRTQALPGGADEVMLESLSSYSTESTSSKTSSTISQMMQSDGINATVLKNSMKSLQESSNHSDNSLYYQSSEYCHKCLLAHMPSLFSDSCENLQPSSDYVHFSPNKSSSFPYPCGHVPSEPSSVSPQRQLSNKIESLSQNIEIEDNNSFKACGVLSNIHEDSRTILKSLSRDYKDTKNAMLLRTLSEEKETLSKKLRHRDLQILNLKKEISCLRFEADLKPKRNGSFHSQSAHQDNDEKLYELSNSISNIQRSINVYCSCLDGNHCDLEKQLQDMENDVSRIKRDLNAMKIQRLENKATQQNAKSSSQVIDKIQEKQDVVCEVTELKKNTQRLESANYCLAKEIAAEVDRLKVDLTVKLHNFCPLITSLEMTRVELQEALALFEDAEKRCCSLNQKLNQTNEELLAFKAMKQSASKASKLLHHCSEKSLENQLLLSETCEDLSMLNDEKEQLKCAVEALMSENKEKDKQLSQALREMEELKKEISYLRTLSEESQ